MDKNAGTSHDKWVPTNIKPSSEEIRLLEFIRYLGWGKVEVEVKAGKPVMLHNVREDVKLTDR